MKRGQILKHILNFWILSHIAAAVYFGAMHLLYGHVAVIDEISYRAATSNLLAAIYLKVFSPELLRRVWG